MAYGDRSVKGMFEDRTIVRMREGREMVLILDRSGREIAINLNKPNSLFHEYKNYVKVTQEFFEWAFLSAE